MILQICGHLIDTQYIYNITKVETTFESVNDYNGFTANGQFIIEFLNSKSKHIQISGYREHKTIHTDGYKKEEAEISRKLNDVRDQLICKWKANQLVIPKIEFDESNITS